MNNNKTLLKKDLTFDELFSIIEEIKKSGDTFILKTDGERDKDYNTVMITFANSKREMIRYDHSDAKEAIRRALLDYFLITN